jgi:hypothetical protein
LHRLLNEQHKVADDEEQEQENNGEEEVIRSGRDGHIETLAEGVELRERQEKEKSRDEDGTPSGDEGLFTANSDIAEESVKGKGRCRDNGPDLGQIDLRNDEQDESASIAELPMIVIKSKRGRKGGNVKTGKKGKPAEDTSGGASIITLKSLF